MCKDGHNIVLSSVTVEGFDTALTEAVDREVRTLLSPLEQEPLDLAGRINLSVIVTDRMPEHVDRINGEYGLHRAPYRRERSRTTAGGIVLTARGSPPFQVVIVVHNEPWTRSDGSAIIERTYLLGYLIAHVVRAGQAEPRSSTDSLKPRTHAAAIRDAAATFIEAFDANRTAIALCGHWLRCDDGGPVPLADTLGSRHVAVAHELAEQLSVFATIDIQFYRITAVGLGDLYPRIGPLLGENMLVLLHALALYGAEDRADALIEALARSPGFRAYIQPELEAIRSALAGQDRVQSEAELGAALERILLRLGLRIEDLPGGNLYVHVSEPVLVQIT
jgi:hypothetical protein